MVLPNVGRPKLDGLSSARFLAALFIALFHCFAMKALTSAPAWAQQISSLGYIAVSFFLVLSGFVLVYGYGGQPVEKFGFWRARLARIYPAYLFSLAFTAFFFFYAVLKLNIPELAWYKAHPLATAVLCLTLLQAWVPQAALGWNSVSWALSVFVFYYLLFPTVARWADRKSTRVLWTLACVTWLGSVGVAVAYHLIKPDHVQYANPYHLNLVWLNALKFNPLMRVSEFLLGIALGFQVIRTDKWKSYGTQMVLGGLALLVGIILMSPWIPYPVMHTGLSAPAFLLLIWGMAARPRITSFLEARPWVLLGDASLSFYLLHANVLGMAIFGGSSTPHASPARIVVAFVIATVLSLLVYRFIEIPGRRWLDKKKESRVQAIAAAR
jgi:peptidoglycan/LPS O-acetylase OafA/YrhL